MDPYVAIAVVRWKIEKSYRPTNEKGMNEWKKKESIGKKYGCDVSSKLLLIILKKENTIGIGIGIVNDNDNDNNNKYRLIPSAEKFTVHTISIPISPEGLKIMISNQPRSKQNEIIEPKFRMRRCAFSSVYT